MVGRSGGGGGGGGFDYVQDPEPAEPEEGEEWYDTGDNGAFVYDGSEWIEQTITTHDKLAGVTPDQHHSTKRPFVTDLLADYTQFSSGETKTYPLNAEVETVRIGASSGGSGTIDLTFKTRTTNVSITIDLADVEDYEEYITEYIGVGTTDLEVTNNVDDQAGIFVEVERVDLS